MISYDYKGRAWVVGYTYPYIRDVILKSTLPYLTYLLIFNYRITEGGILVGTDEDIEVIQTAKQFDTPSTLVLTSYSSIGDIELKVEYGVLFDVQLQDRIIDQLLSILSIKGYSGVNLAFQFINTTNQQLYLNFLIKVSERMHLEGYSVFLTINPGLSNTEGEISFEQINYSPFSDESDGILFLSYDWASIDRSPMQDAAVITGSFLEYIITQVPLDKIRIGLPTLGYDWQLPYVEGRTRARALNFESVMALAREVNAVIYYDENSLTAYFEYTDIDINQHIVRFKDARSIDSILKLIQGYGIYGVGIWNIMNDFAQMWLVINTQYEIINV
ncbi:MAG: hypothetical protein K0R34_1588 [Herbinix sp.]|nr:hypothetical protein [Herbinix sp.]